MMTDHTKKKRHAPLIRSCQVLQHVLPSSVTDHMPIHLHLDLPTSSNPVPPTPPHTSPARTLYHSKRLKDPQTKNAFTSALAKKVAKISHTFTRLSTQLHSSKITPQSFADAGIGNAHERSSSVLATDRDLRQAF